MTPDIKPLVFDWMDAWNKKDIDSIMKHYVDDIVFYSPTVVKRWEISEGKIQGKAKLKEHFLKAFELFPDLHFEFISLLYGIDGIMIVYKRETGILAADIVTLNTENKCTMVKAYYAEMNNLLKVIMA